MFVSVIMMSRCIFHVDMNNFYASVECMYDPSLNNVPMVVGGDEQARHGIVLSKNEIAKKVYGVRTGEILWQVRKRCPDLVVVYPHQDKYLKFSKMAMELYGEYSDRVESFGLDEAWIDVTHFGAENGKKLADGLRSKIKNEMGLTVSVGVSFNKVFAKLGSDMKKPDATTVLTENNYRRYVWPHDVSELLYVGRATCGKLKRLGIETIGDLACFNKAYLHDKMGKWGDVLWAYANGLDSTPVALKESNAQIKSIGNSTTTPRDLLCDEDVKLVLFSLSDSVSHRLRMSGLWGNVAAINVRDNELISFERQCKFSRPTQLSSEIAEQAFDLFKNNYDWSKPVRSIGVRVTDLQEERNIQLDFFGLENKRDTLARLEKTADDIRRRFGNDSIYRASMLNAPEITNIEPKLECFSGYGRASAVNK